MRIGVMMREIANQTDAPGIIVLNLMDKILELDRENEYVLFYRTDDFIDRYNKYANVRSVIIAAGNKLMWDQFAVPRAAKREQVDLIFHPKHSIPLLTRCKTLMQLRGPEYWINPQYYELLDLVYQRVALRLFSLKATHLIAESKYASDAFQEYLGIPQNKMNVVYLAPSDRFRQVTEDGECQAVRQRHKLPNRFILTVTRVVQGKKTYGGKNIVNMLEAYRNSRAREQVKFVIVGRQTREFFDHHLDANDELRDDLVVLDFIPQKELPALYSLADLFLFPSRNESFGIPILEAMSCGCPVITSNTTACAEIAGDAARLVDPEDVQDIVAAIDELVLRPSIREQLCLEGFKRAKEFSWVESAKQTIALFKQLGSDASGRLEQ